MTFVETSLADSWPGIALLYLSFLYFLGGALGYGNLLRRRLLAAGSAFEAAGDTFLLTTVFLAGLAFTLSSLRVLVAIPWLFWWLFPLAGYAGLRGLPLRAALRRRWPVAVLVGFVFLLRSLSASIPLQHGDPLLYHLLAPHVWARAGGFFSDPLLPNLPLASSWECLYLWPQLLWRGGSLDGLIEAQIFSQWLHLFLGWGGCALLVPRLFKGVVEERNLYLLALAALFVAGVQWTAAVAKNDAGVAFWALGCVVFLKEGWDGTEKEKTPATIRFVLSGVFAGLAVAGKVTTVLSIVPLGAALLLSQAPWRNLPLLARWGSASIAGALLGAVPFYARNFLLTGNPFYPLFARIFPSPALSHSWGVHFSKVAPTSPLHALPTAVARLHDLPKESPWIVAVLLLPILLPLRGKPTGRSVPALLLGACGSYVIFVTTQVPEIELRYLGASLMVLAAGGVWSLLCLAEWLVSARVARIWSLLLLAGLLASSKLPLHILRKIWHGPIGVAYLRVHTAGEAKAWLRAHAWPSTVVMAGENEAYYLTPLKVTVLTEKPDLDAATWAEKDPLRFVESVCRLAKARFLLDSIPSVYIEARFGRKLLAPSIVFAGQGAQVYDLSLLEAHLKPNGPHFCRSL